MSQLNRLDDLSRNADDSNWETLYCSHLWNNSNLRKAVIDGSSKDRQLIKYCYSCRGKTRKYELRPANESFIPKNFSTPNKAVNKDDDRNNACKTCLDNQNEITHSRELGDLMVGPKNDNTNIIPTISRYVDSSFRQKYTSYEMRPNNATEGRLRKSLKGIGCIVNFSSDSPVKKRTQIQACSISMMILAIVVISFVLVNFTTPSFSNATKDEMSIIVVPTSKKEHNNETHIIKHEKVDSPSPIVLDPVTPRNVTTTEKYVTTSEKTSLLTDIMIKIRKNIKTFPKDAKKSQVKPKEIINRDLSQRFCSCQTHEVCMLDENTGKAVCKKAIDIADPTGCGGLCALETEACQMVDRARGVRVCRLLTLVTCLEDEWRCKNGLCVPAQARCDGLIQCYDRSDEMHCECDLTKQFRCGHLISCFTNSKLCDGVIDCWDGIDEVNCTTVCPDSQFTCNNGQCIKQLRFCDGLADCTDGSDEPYGCDGACSAHEMRCKNHRCVSRALQCDGHDNCGDSSDELHCS